MAENLSMALTAGTSQTSRAITSNAVTTNQNIYVARFSVPLSVTSLTAQTWTLALAAAEASTNANAFLAPAVYVWRPSNSSKIGTVYDAETQLGTELGATISGRVVTFSGSSVASIQAGDLLVLEVWTDQTQAMGTAYANTIYYDGTVDVTANSTTSAASYLSTPQDGVVTAPAAYTQSAFRGRNDDGSQTAATWIDVANTNFGQVRDTNFRLRFVIGSATAAPTQNKAFQLRYSKNGGAYADVTGASTNARASASTQFTDAAATTQQLGSGTFNAGTMDEVDGAATGFTATPALNHETELEYCLQLRSADVAVGDTVDFRIYESGNALTTYSQTPRATASAAPVNTDVRVSFPTPSDTLQTGAGLQEFRVLVRKKGTGGNPQARVELWETGGGSALATVVANTSVTSTTGVVLSGTFNAASLSSVSGSGVEARVIGTGAAGGSLEVGSIEWNATVGAAQAPAPLLPITTPEMAVFY